MVNFGPEAMPCRRDVLAGAASSAALLMAGSGAAAQDVIGLEIAADYDAPGRRIPADFTGLSYESAILAANYFSPENRSVLGLLRRLGRTGVLRIGGNTSDRTVWDGGTKVVPLHDIYVITPAIIDQLAAFLRILGWRLIYGLNLGNGTPETAAEEAAYVAHAVGPHLLAFQIGNEPDGFGAWSGMRPPGYDVSAFVAEWRAFADAILSRVADAHFAGPAVAAEAQWMGPFVAAARDRLVLLTRHYYADGPARAPHVNVQRLLRSAPQARPVLEGVRTVADNHGLPYRITETNSIFAEGHRGLSDSLAAALWGVEWMFQVAEAGGAGVNFHAGDHKFYTPIAPSAEGRRHAKPLYFAMLMFSEAGRGALVPAHVEPPDSDVTVYATRADDGTLCLCLINKHLTRPARARIDPGRHIQAASLLRLTGDAANATTGLTFGGAGVGDFGSWMPLPAEPAQRQGRLVIAAVPPASAMIISMATA
jgi:hypothetical protein